MKIHSVKVSEKRVDSSAGRISLNSGSNAPSSTNYLIVRIDTDSGISGFGVTSFGPSGLTAGKAILEELIPLVVGEDPLATEKLWAKARGYGSSLGWSGILPRVYAAIDLALWDIKGKSFREPLHRYFGSARASAPYFLGDIAPLGIDTATVLSTWKKYAANQPLGLLVKIGTDDIQKDADRVHDIRNGIGDEAWLGITAEGRYDLGTAMAFARFFDEEIGIDWFESPIATSDVAGYERLSLHFEAPLCVGPGIDSVEEFRDWLARGTVRILRPDPIRLGGLTPLLRVIAMADAYHVPCVIKGLPDLAIHLACGIANMNLLDWSEPFQTLKIEKGQILAPEKPGIGWEF
ncbi:mandelate racemase/muconate lactonizing enzyme family protein [Telmatocola sphagniphila]|uniref:Mandelate racemase/muconate lactonizing enzyme family protein n=1 Tax=Telmatocola sphagniphila TaxID=1123043 RepID=A0A8E6B545_9BACT|nr:mandelate racemase/muconate lactonizing enzyme family protein [Telmatocola sphagniphila]QVL32113.1 mandelate racemase/muconate lactonizing enzyme family protein [Telmatocola sphagniphila]